MLRLIRVSLFTGEVEANMVGAILTALLSSECVQNYRTKMNHFEAPGLPSEARVRYLDGDYQVEEPGNFVRCAVTGQAIPLEELKYWSVELQEPYFDAETSFKRLLETRKA